MDANKTAASILSKDTAKRRVKMDSTDIKSAGWDPKTRQLTIRFHSGPEVYLYENVPSGIYKRLIAANSAGRCFANHIKGKFKFRVAK
jgi:KTSC domain-containing protein